MVEAQVSDQEFAPVLPDDARRQLAEDPQVGDVCTFNSAKELAHIRTTLTVLSVTADSVHTQMQAVVKSAAGQDSVVTAYKLGYPRRILEAMEQAGVITTIVRK